MLTHRDLQRLFDGGPRVVALEQRRSIYSTSCAVDDVLVRFADDTSLVLILKSLGWDAMLPDARRTKPRFLYDPAREIGVYRQLLEVAPPGTARCYGTSADDAVQPWILLEKVDGVELYQVGDLSRWAAAAEWLASFHARYSSLVPRLETSGVPLLRHDDSYYRIWPERARRVVRDIRLDWLLRRYDAVHDRLMALPRTLIHGEFYASNVLVGPDRVCPIDWEMAAIGPPLIDLAALTSGGSWSDQDLTALVTAYCGGDPTGELLADLDACRVQLALQWLGWAEHWVPPTEHAQDWLSEAVAAAERLAL